MGGVAASVCAWLSDAKASTSAAHIHNLVMTTLQFPYNILRMWRSPVLVHSGGGCQRAPDNIFARHRNDMVDIIARAKQRAGIA